MMEPGTYTEAQYLTPGAKKMICGWLAQGDTEEQVAFYLSRTLRVGGIRVCRQIVAEAKEGDER